MPRLPALSLTPEDYDIWLWGSHDRHTYAWDQMRFRLERISETTDRRDARLMFDCQYARYRMFPVDMPPLEMLTAGGEILACGGARW